MRTGPFLGATMALALMASPSWACKGPNLLFSDDFTVLDEAWTSWNSGTIKVEDGKALLVAEPGYYNATFYEGEFFPLADICVDLTSPAADSRDALSTWAGIMFGATSYQDFYVFMIRPNGSAEIARHTKSGWLNPVPAKKADSVKQGAGATNSLRLKLGKATATAYINDKQFATFKVVSGENAKFGLYTESEGSTWTYSGLKISD
jgi:hypothetical protein